MAGTGLTDSEELVADLLSGRRSHISDDVPRHRGDDERSDDTIVKELGEALDELDELRRQDPESALEELRGLLSNDKLEQPDLTSFIDVWRRAVNDAPGFAEEVQAQERGPRDWWNNLRAFLHRPVKPDAEQKNQLRLLEGTYRFPRHPLAPKVNPNERVFETFDPSWVPLLKAALGERSWPKGLNTFRRHQSPKTYSYLAVDQKGQRLASDKSHTVGLFADFGTGYYHSWGIAEQLAAWAFPYVFHLGDVYYAGRSDEFERRFEAPLFDVVEKSWLLGLAENHELYYGGASYLQYFDTLRHRGRTPQEGSYFSVQFPHHQIIALDVNWQGRCRFADAQLHGWLEERIAEAGERTIILLTGNAPFKHGDENPNKLLADLMPFLNSGRIGLWFWGDDHYCALFDRNVDVPFYGSCIGHGGYPGERQEKKARTYKTSPLWLETEPRFPKQSGLRPDMTNNGWCQMTLRADGGVDLLYVDWLWCKRASVSFNRGPTGLAAGPVHEFERDVNPVQHRP